MFRTVYYTVESGGNGRPIRVALISDLHRSVYGDNQCDLMDAIAREHPAALLMCGDIFHCTPTEGSRDFLRAAAAAYPCYYVTGNHENANKNREELLQFVRNLGITILQGDCAVFEANSRRLNLCGIDDPRRFSRDMMREQLERASQSAPEGNYTILLAHRPEYIEDYLAYGFDLVLAGHAHGGQWRIPGIMDGFFASGQGFFPRYTGGRYDFGRQTMILGRGLTEFTHFVPRILNPPELVMIDLV